MCREAAKAFPEEARKKLQKILLKYFSPMVTKNTSGENMHGSGLVILVIVACSTCSRLSDSGEEAEVRGTQLNFPPAVLFSCSRSI